MAAFAEPRALTNTVLVALTVAFGLQMLRAMLSLLVYVLRDNYAWGVTWVGILALAIFATGFLAGPVTRGLGATRAMAIGAASLGLLRLAAQVWQGAALVDLCLSIAGVVLFILFLFAFSQRARSSAIGGMTGYGVAFLLGVALDTLLMGAFNALDPFWQQVPAALSLFAVLCGTQIACLAHVWSQDKSAPDSVSESTGARTSAPWLALGAVIFIELQVFQNLAGLAAATGWTLPDALLWATVSNAVGLWVIPGFMMSRVRNDADQETAGSRLSYPRWWEVLLLGALLIAALGLQSDQPVITAAALIVGQCCLSVLLVTVFTALGEKPEAEGRKAGSLAYGVGMLLLMVLLFGFYASLELDLLFPREALLPAAGVIVAIAALRAVVPAPPSANQARMMWQPAAIASLFIIAPIVMFLAWDSPKPATSDGRPVRMMTYNLHNGFNTDGRLNMEALAQVIEQQEADVIGLQEVSRGWLINGGGDMLEWLSRRLDMPYVYGPATGRMWGNAILSRVPVIEWGRVALPPSDLQLTRQLLWATLDLGLGQELHVINTHFHHVETEGHVREQQAQALIDFWGGAPRTVVLGDLNAEPDSPEMLALWQAGLRDALEGVALRQTFPSEAPTDSIDYVLGTADLLLEDPAIPVSTASDHLPVLATVELKEQEGGLARGLRPAIGRTVDNHVHHLGGP